MSKGPEAPSGSLRGSLPAGPAGSVPAWQPTSLARLPCPRARRAAPLPSLQDGLAAIRADNRTFGCYDSKWLAILYGELGISAAILAAGYNLDSLMLRYQGVDWRQPENWGCNAGERSLGALPPPRDACLL